MVGQHCPELLVIVPPSVSLAANLASGCLASPAVLLQQSQGPGSQKASAPLHTTASQDHSQACQDIGFPGIPQKTEHQEIAYRQAEQPSGRKSPPKILKPNVLWLKGRWSQFCIFFIRWIQRQFLFWSSAVCKTPISILILYSTHKQQEGILFHLWTNFFVRWA